MGYPYKICSVTHLKCLFLWAYFVFSPNKELLTLNLIQDYVWHSFESVLSLFGQCNTEHSWIAIWERKLSTCLNSWQEIWMETVTSGVKNLFFSGGKNRLYSMMLVRESVCSSLRSLYILQQTTPPPPQLAGEALKAIRKMASSPASNSCIKIFFTPKRNEKNFGREIFRPKFAFIELKFHWKLEWSKAKAHFE